MAYLTHINKMTIKIVGLDSLGFNSIYAGLFLLLPPLKMPTSLQES